MRAVLTISLPEQKKKNIEERAEKAGKTISGYILYAIDLEQHLISEDELAERVREAEKNYRDGKTKELKTLADLIE